MSIASSGASAATRERFGNGRWRSGDAIGIVHNASDTVNDLSVIIGQLDLRLNSKVSLRAITHSRGVVPAAGFWPSPKAMDMATVKPWEWDPDKQGRLSESDDGEIKAIFGGRYASMGRGDFAKPAYRSSRPVSASGRMPPYFSMSFVSKRRSAPAPAEAPAGRRWVVPERGKRPADAKYDRAARCWHVPSNSPAAAGDHRRATVSKGARAPGTAARFQDYIDRAREGDDRDTELTGDEEGALSFGSEIGGTPAERHQFWQELEERERADGRVQGRVQCELPAGLEPSDYREIVERFCEAFRERGLPFWAAVHRPHVEEGSDPRNIHLHVVWSERPVRRRAAGVWDFAARKDREARGPAWVVGMRDRFCEIAADVQRRRAEARGEPAVGLYDARGYAELGIDKVPGEHLGRRRMRLERAGVPTELGVENARREEEHRTLLRLDDATNRASATCEAVGGWVDELAQYRTMAVGYGREGEALLASVSRVEGTREAAVALRLREDELEAELTRRRSERERRIGRAVLREEWAQGELAKVGRDGPLRRRLEGIVAEAHAAAVALEGEIRPEVLAAEEAVVAQVRSERQAAEQRRLVSEREMAREVEAVVLRVEIARVVEVVQGLAARQGDLEQRVSEAAWSADLHRRRLVAERTRERSELARGALVEALRGTKLDLAGWLAFAGAEDWLERLRRAPGAVGIDGEMAERLAAATLRYTESDRDTVQRVGEVATLERIDRTLALKSQRVRSPEEERELATVGVRRRELEQWLLTTPEGRQKARALGPAIGRDARGGRGG